MGVPLVGPAGVSLSVNRLVALLNRFAVGRLRFGDTEPAWANGG